MKNKFKLFFKKFFQHRADNIFKIFFALILILIVYIIFGIQLNNIYQKSAIVGSNKWQDLIYYFTNQSNILVLITMTLFFTSFRKNPKFSGLAFITLTSILFTFIVNHAIVDREEIQNFSFFSSTKHYRHTIIPILYTIFYFFKNISPIAIKKVYISLIHPSAYFYFFLIRGLFDKETKYPYPFIDPTQKGIFNITSEGGQGYFLVLLMSFILTILFYFYNYGLAFIKNRYFSYYSQDCFIKNNK
ncbi:MAG: Pr6Pr family membrane protein [Candidatus Phytoplasma pyri]|uniref:Pr6Pr family membrane protein n=1 Tax=Candidatus Phytoplasma pyri TaxID=47566 RepID=UPI0039833EA4